MNARQVEHYVMRYLNATESQILEKSPGKVTVKLSPAADKELTGRSYYWSFVERTGAEPETMTYTFVFDPEKVAALQQAKREQEGPSDGATEAKSPFQPQSDSILGRYFGFIPNQARGRNLEENVYFGCGRLEQVFKACKTHGQFANLYEIPQEQPGPYQSTAYTSWFAVNFKVEFVCDMKREEIHSLAISLSTGELIEQAFTKLLDRRLSPRLPAHTHVKETISLPRAWFELEKYVEQKIRNYDHAWSYRAQNRLMNELNRIHGYYKELIEAADPEAKREFELQYDNRKREIRWQYEPRVQVNAINGGIFHLVESYSLGYDVYR